MTSPISLLAPLAGADPAPAPQTAEDPAVFAAALIAAIQQLQAPVRSAAVVEAPLTLEIEGEGEGEGEAIVEGEGEGEAIVEGEGAGEVVDAVGEGKAEPGQSSALPGNASTASVRTSARPANNSGAPGAPALPDVPGAPASSLAASGRPPTAPGAPGAPAAPANASATPRARTDREPIPAPTMVDVVSDEPATPEPARTAYQPAPSRGTPSQPATRRAEPTVVIPPGEEQAGQDGAPEVEVAAMRPADSGARALPQLHAAHPSVRSERRPGPAGEKPGRPEAGAEPAETPATATAPPPANAALLAVPASPPSPPPMALPDDTETESRSGRRQQPSPGGDRAGATEPVSAGSVATQARNARLATRLAELVGDMNLTEFRVELARRRVSPSSSGEGPEVEPPAQPGAEPEVEGRTGQVTRPGAEVPVAPAGRLAAAATPRANRDRPAETAPALNRVADAAVGRPKPAPVETAMPAPARVPAEEAPRASSPPLRSSASEPTLPAVRQELPAEEKAVADYRPGRAAAARIDRESPSEPAAPLSLAAPNLAERMTERNETGIAVGTREARNLPPETTGNDRPAGLADRVTVQVSDAEGRQTRIRVSVFGDQVRAVITPPDPESARQLERRMDDLQTALARQGFAGSKVVVRQAGDGAIELGGAAMAGLTGGNEGRTATSPGREQPAGDQRQGRNHRDQQPGDGQRHPHGRSRDQGAEHRRR